MVPGIWICGTMGNYDKSRSSCNVHNNLILGCGTNTHIEWVGGIVTSGFHNVKIQDNTFVKCFNAGVTVEQVKGLAMGDKDAGFEILVKNNIIVGSIARALNGKGTGYGLSNKFKLNHKIISEGNCIWGCASSAYFGEVVKGVNDVLADPMLTEDYHLKSCRGRWNGKSWICDFENSPCIYADHEIGRWNGTSEASKTWLENIKQKVTVIIEAESSKRLIELIKSVPKGKYTKGFNFSFSGLSDKELEGINSILGV